MTITAIIVAMVAMTSNRNQSGQMMRFFSTTSVEPL